jgi:hypothetical protein
VNGLNRLEGIFSRIGPGGKPSRKPFRLPLRARTRGKPSGSRGLRRLQLIRKPSIHPENGGCLHEECGPSGFEDPHRHSVNKKAISAAAWSIWLEADVTKKAFQCRFPCIRIVDKDFMPIVLACRQLDEMPLATSLNEAVKPFPRQEGAPKTVILAVEPKSGNLCCPAVILIELAELV